ncbi:MAG: leucine-rich repeat domain-containing protein [Mycoplasmoidaceae bacterium]|nr:leucine-rich repeat domain-containing protein [Mycoplasmoidaceae bacterium]
MKALKIKKISSIYKNYFLMHIFSFNNYIIINMRKVKILSFLTLNLLCYTSFLSSCSTSKNPTNIDAKIEAKGEKISFSNNCLPVDKGAKYSINVTGDIEYGDLVFIQLSNQKKNGSKDGVFVNVSSETNFILLNKSESTFSFTVNSLVLSQELYSVTFTANFQIIRNHSTIFRSQIDNFYFFNATPTTDQMFITEETNDGKKLISLNLDETYKPQLELCNLLIIPKGITEICKRAFRKDEAALIVSTIPPNIKYIILDQSLLFPDTKPTLKTIGEEAFEQANFENGLFLPKSLQTIEQKAFIRTVLPSEFSLPESLTTIYDDAFNNARGLTKISFPKTLTQLRSRAFEMQHNLLTVDLSDFGPGELPPG